MNNDFDYLKTDAELLGRNIALLLNKKSLPEIKVG